MKLRIKGAAPALLLALGGCVFGPTCRKPPPPTAAEGPFVSTTGQLTDANGQLPDRWWQLYRDPNVDRLVKKAFAANTDLRQAIARLDQARATLAQTRAAALPQTLLSGAARYKRGSITGPGAANGFAGSGISGIAATGSGDSAATNTTEADTNARMIYSAGFDIAYEVDLFGRVRRSIEAARADAQAQAAAADYVRVTVAAETTRAYVGACAAARQVAVARKSLTVIQQQVELYRRRLEAGAVQPADFDQQAALAEQQAAMIPPLESQRRAALFNLAMLTGKTPAEIDPAADRCTAPPPLITPLPIGDGAALLRRRPDIRQAERTLAAQNARIGVAIADLFPKVSLGGSVVSAGTGLQSMTSRSGISFAVGPLVNWTFPNIAVARAEIAGARAATAGALAAFDGSILSALNETERALTTYATEHDRNDALRRARDRQQDAFNAILARARLGGTSPIDVLTAERTLVQAETDLASSDAALVDDVVTVFKALGGGWQQAPG